MNILIFQKGPSTLDYIIKKEKKKKKSNSMMLVEEGT